MTSRVPNNEPLSREMHRFLDEMSRDTSLVSRTTWLFAELPSSPKVGMLRTITDSSTATWGATIAGSGANQVLAWFNGTNWTVVGI
jgi:hypothetical protein